MSQRFKLIKDGKPLNPSAIFTDYDMDATTSQTVFDGFGTITSSSKVDVFLEGALQREGSGNDYVLDVSAGEVTFASAPGDGKWVRIRKWIEGA